MLRDQDGYLDQLGLIKYLVYFKGFQRYQRSKVVKGQSLEP